MRLDPILLAMTLAVAGCTTANPPPSEGRTVRETSFRRELSAFVDQLRADPHAPPGFVVTATNAEGIVFEGAYGVRDLATGAAMTLDTPIYNASVTKAYTGLLAAILDEQGALPLETTLRDAWPTLTLPAPLDADAIDARRLLSHTSGVSAGGLIFRSVFTGDISAAEVPAHLALYARANDAQFAYSNTGPFIYSAMVEARTGESWRQAMRRRVLAPLGLSRTIVELETLPRDEIAHCHGRLGGAWRSLPHKPTIVMNAAGGMYASGRDSSRFLRAFLSDGASARGRISSAALRATWTPTATQDRTLWGMRRDGYGLGWDLGAIDGHRFVSRSGGYAGCRAIILFLPDESFGIAVLSAGDAAANTFNAAILGHAIDLWTGASDIDRRSQTRVAEYARAAADEMARIAAAEAALPVSSPIDPVYARSVTGVYENTRLGRVAVHIEEDRLVVTGGAFAADLRRIEADRFAIVSRDEVESQVFEFRRSLDGAVSSFLWDDDLYDRVR